MNMEIIKARGHYFQVVDSYPDKVTCHPIGGGFVGTIFNENIEERNATLPRGWHKQLVGFDNCELGIYNAFIMENDFWNGWLNPYLTEDEAKRFAINQEVIFDHELDYCGSADKWTFKDGVLYQQYFDDEDDYLARKDEPLDKVYEDGSLTAQMITPDEIEFGGETVKVWGVGYGYCWQEWTSDCLLDLTPEERAKYLPKGAL